MLGVVYSRWRWMIWNEFIDKTLHPVVHHTTAILIGSYRENPEHGPDHQRVFTHTHRFR